MSNLTREDIEEVLSKVFTSRTLLENAEHEKHHEFIQMEIERRKRNKERWEKFQNSFIGGIALALLGWLGWLGLLIIEWIRHGRTTP